MVRWRTSIKSSKRFKWTKRSKMLFRIRGNWNLRMKNLSRLSREWMILMLPSRLQRRKSPSLRKNKKNWKKIPLLEEDLRRRLLLYSEKRQPKITKRQLMVRLLKRRVRNNNKSVKRNMKENLIAKMKKELSNKRTVMGDKKRKNIRKTKRLILRIWLQEQNIFRAN